MNVDTLTTRRRGLGATVAVVLGLLLGWPSAAHAVLSITASPATPRPGEPVRFSATGSCDGTCASWSWKVGSSTILDTGSGYPDPVTYTEGFSKTGAFKVTLSYSRWSLFPPWSFDIVKDVTVVGNGAPTASFTVSPSAPTIGQAVTFTDTSTDPEGDTLTRAWDLDNDGSFDDGDGQTASRTFPTRGAKTVRLQVTDEFGAVSTTSRSVTVANVAPTVALNVTPTTVQTGDTVAFSAVASDLDGGAVTYAWDLNGDGAYDDSAAAAPPARSYPRAGTHTIGVRVTDDDGDPANSAVQRTQVVTVTNRAPSAPTISPQPGSAARGESVQLTASATDPEGTALTFAWDLDGDGAYDDETASVVTRTMPQSGTLAARVRATDADGGTAVSAPFSLAATDPPPADPPPADPPQDPPPGGDPGAVAPTGDPGTPFVSDPPAAMPPPAAASTGAPKPQTTAKTPRLMRPFPRVRIQGRLTRRGAQFTRITVTAPRGSRVTAACRGRGCPRRSTATTGRTGVVRLSGLLGTYRAGTRIVIRVTRAGTIGKHTTIVVRRGRAPQRTDRCLRPGATVPTRCPAN